MEFEEIKKDMEGLVKELMVKEGVDRYQLHFEGKSEIGDNYGGEILFLKVEPEGAEKPYHLVAKTTKRAVELRKWMPIDMIYDREIFVYAKLFPAFRKLIEDTQSGLTFDFVPKVYLISDIQYKQTLILENLKTKGFKLHDRKKPWNLEHCLLAMKKYGEFHALSLALNDQKPDVYKGLASQMKHIHEEFNKTLDFKTFVGQPLSHILQMLEKIGRQDLVKKYDGFLEVVVDTMNEYMGSESDRIVLGHNDCWNNNFMFRYQDDDETKPASICFLDFQLSTPCSPVRDLSYNIYATCDKSCLDHLDQILKTYHASLSRCLEQLGSIPDQIFTFDQLMTHWRKYAKFGVITCLLVMKICLIDKENVPDYSEISKKAENVEAFTEGMDVAMTNPDEYNRRVLDVFIHFGENFL